MLYDMVFTEAMVEALETYYNDWSKSYYMALSDKDTITADTAREALKALDEFAEKFGGRFVKDYRTYRYILAES